MKVGRQAVVRKWCEWHLICTAMVHQAWMIMRMQRSSWQNVGYIVLRNYSVAVMLRISGKQYKSAIRNMSRIIASCMLYLEGWIDVENKIDGNEERY